MTARLPRGTWLEGGAVHLDDAHGWPTTIPARVAHLMLQIAKNNDDGRAVWGLRPFDRDTLQGAVDLLDARDQCTYEDRWTRCDQYTPQDLTQPRPRCDAHKLEN